MNREIINKLLHTPATIQVGKQGVTDTLLQEVNAQLKKKKIVKVRILKSLENVDETLHQLERNSVGKIVKKVGRTAIIAQKDARK